MHFSEGEESPQFGKGAGILRLAKGERADVHLVPMELLAPAKVNLSLNIRGKRADGFHEIETLMVPISLADRLVLNRGGEGIRFSCSDSTLPCDENNLAVRAAKLFFGHTRLAPSVEIALEKRVPHGAGLGGGSSDAATVLLGLNELFATGLERGVLAEWAALLGSDIPFFIWQSPAICRGRGEQVTPEAFKKVLPLLLVKPSFGVPTPWAYQQWSQSREIPEVPYGPQEFEWGKLCNDLERPVFEKYLVLPQLKCWLLQQPEVAGALMSGSGSTCFALLGQAGSGAALGERVRQEFGEDFWTAECSTLPAAG